MGGPWDDNLFWPGKRVLVTGGAGFLGRVLCRRLKGAGCRSVLVPRRDTYDLTRADHVARLFHDSCPNVVFHLAAEVGGIGANRAHPGRFFYANLSMGMHLIEEARLVGVDKFIQIGTVCSYPKFCPVPFRENTLWDGYPEETNAPYGIAKKSLLVMLQAYRREYGFNGVYLMPVNLYGPGDDFDPQTSHVIPALIRKFCEAKRTGRDCVRCWGTGEPSREFLYVDDAAKAIALAGASYNDADPINLGSGREIKIRDLASMIADLVEFKGRIEWDASQPDGQPRRRLDVSRADERLGWTASTHLETGLRRTIDWWRSRGEGRPDSASEDRLATTS